MGVALEPKDFCKLLAQQPFFMRKILWTGPSKIHAHRVATRSAEQLPFGTFAPTKSKGGRLKQEALASGRHWLGGRNGPEQNRAASAIPKARHSPQRHR